MSRDSEDQLDHYHIRPRFKVVADTSIDEITAKVKRGLEASKDSCVGNVNESVITLQVPVNDRHYWSPQLAINLQRLEDGRTVLRGLFGPRPTVWTMFVFFYTLIGLAVLLVGILGLSYYSLKKPTTVLWWIPILGAVFLSLYLVAFFGQKLGKKQMDVLRSFFESSLGINIAEQHVDELDHD